MVNIAPDFPIEGSSMEPRVIEQGLLSPVFLAPSFARTPHPAPRRATRLEGAGQRAASRRLGVARQPAQAQSSSACLTETLS